MIRFRTSQQHTLSVEGIRVTSDLTSVEILGRDDGGDELCMATINNPLSFPLADYEIADYKIALFTHSRWPESRVLNLVHDNGRVGLLFSLQALASQQSVLPDKASWNEYGFIALQKICLGEFDYGPTEFPVSQEADVPLTQLFSDDTIVLVLDRLSCLATMDEESFHNLVGTCLPAFARYGFYRLDDSSRPGDFRANALAIESKQTTLTLTPYSTTFPPDARAFFEKIMLTSVQREQNPAFRLFLGYQGLEILMADLYSRLVKTFAEQAATATTSVEVRTLNDALLEAMKEKNRLAQVFNANRGPQTNSSFEVLLNSCDSLLVNLDETFVNAGGSSKNPESALYLVRNHVFHSFVRAASFEGELEVIAQSLFVLLCELAIHYHLPG